MRTDIALAVLGAVGSVSAFWRMPCRGRVGLARIDPLVNPGEIAQHVHAIHGSSGFSETATYEDLRNGDCTSCGVLEDKSVYWAPVPYFKHANGTYELVPQIGGMLNYYFLNVDAKHPEREIKAFPNDFRMIAGDSHRRNYSIGGLSVKEKDPEKSFWAQLGQTTQIDLEQRAVGFNCLNYQIPPEGSLYRHYLPEKSFLDSTCKDGIRIEIAFPSCWNGKDVDSPNHRSHVAYPDLVITGSCPEGFDVKLPGLFYETIWATNAFEGKEGEFAISNGDPQGFGYHADFMNGWDVDFLQQAVNLCTAESGNVEDCPIFSLQSENDQRKCQMKKLPDVLADEKVDGVVGNALPGNVLMQYGPEPATAKNPGPKPSTTVPVPSAPYSAGEKPTGTDYLPGQVFKEISSTTTTTSAPTEAAPTPLGAAQVTRLPEPAAAAVEEDGYDIVRTDYVTQGNVVNMVIVKEKLEYVTITTTTVTSTATFQAKPRRSAHVHRHQRRHGRH